MATAIRMRLYFNPRDKEELKKNLLTFDNKTQQMEVDFNKIVRMPEELGPDKTTYDDESIKGLTLFMETSDLILNRMQEDPFFSAPVDRDIYEMLKKHIDGAKVPLTLKQAYKDDHYINKFIKGMTEKDFAHYFSIGGEQASNIEDYGGANWVDWRTRNWGTRFNAYDTKVGDKTIDFKVDGTPALQAIINLSKKLPDHTPLAVMFAEEGFGKQVGYMLITDGQIDPRSKLHMDNTARDAIDMNRDLWGIQDGYVYDRVKKEFKNVSRKEASLA